MPERLATDAAGSAAANPPAPAREGNRTAHDARLPGCRSRPLVHYLKALGLFRIVSRQADPTARARWAGGTLVLRSSLNEDTLATFLLERYAPTPVVSPWNGGSGFFPKDNKEGIDAIDGSAGARLAAFRSAIGTSRAVLAKLEITEKPTGDDALKIRLVRHLRAQLDDDALEWLDASIVLLGPNRAFPPLLGSGGNDGRYDFANNYAQAVVTATALAGGEKAQELARRQLANALYREPVALKKMSAGHFLRDSSPVNSPAGESDGLGNPWDLVLAVEGCCLLVAGAARRHQTGAAGALVAPFTARPTAAGYGSAVAGEKGRAELWLPLWSRWTSLPELTALVREGRAQVGRRQARSGLDFVRAVGELGVARGIDGFERFALLERAGQSTLAVPVGTIAVRERPHARALHTLDRWLPRVQAYGHGDCPRAHARAVARLDRRLFAFADRESPETACGVLEALGELESLLAASHLGANVEREFAPLTGADLEPWLQASDDGSHEFAVAAALATLHDPSSSRLPAIRDYMHGTGRDERGRPTYAPGISHAIARRADPITRLAQLHVRRHVDAARTPHDDIRPDSEHGVARQRQLTFPYGVTCPLASARKFAAGTLDDRRIMRLVAGLTLLQPRLPIRDGDPPWHPAVKDVAGTPVPTFDLLALAFAGTYRARPETGEPAEEYPRSTAPFDDKQKGVPLQPRPGWAAQLAACRVDPASRQRDTQYVRPVLRDALLRLRMAGLTPLVTVSDLLADTPSGPRLAAALLLHLPGRDRDHIATSLTTAVGPSASTSSPHRQEGEPR
ncbi:MAG TPA: type I-U CRISPR-associated protein Csx17 [Solirubrobacteraceae bacterium]|nr:type I-U CRISPR-associated protein Csx17 [Solirubrobacteraceae bacterium]